MPTRKELTEQLSHEIDELSDSISSQSRAISDSNADLAEAQDALRSELGALSGTLETSLERQAANQQSAANTISKGLNDLGDNLIAVAVGGGAMLLQGKVLSFVIERIQEINRKSKMIESIQYLQTTQKALSYQSAVERSSAAGASKDQRQTILNELIHDGIVTVENSDGCETLRIEPENPELKKYWEWIESLRDEAR